MHRWPRGLYRRLSKLRHLWHSHRPLHLLSLAQFDAHGLCEQRQGSLLHLPVRERISLLHQQNAQLGTHRTAKCVPALQEPRRVRHSARAAAGAALAALVTTVANPTATTTCSTTLAACSTGTSRLAGTRVDCYPRHDELRVLQGMVLAYNKANVGCRPTDVSQRGWNVLHRRQTRSQCRLPILLQVAHVGQRSVDLPRAAA